MWRIVQHQVSDDYVLAMGETTKIRDFVQKCFNYLGIEVQFEGSGVNEIARIKRCSGEHKIKDGSIVLKIDPRYYRPTEVELLIGDSTKARTVLGWKPTYDLNGLIKDMMDSDMLLFSKEQYLKVGGHSPSERHHE
jgi:GDPmannose 4,6-dehydratase